MVGQAVALDSTVNREQGRLTYTLVQAHLNGALHLVVLQLLLLSSVPLALRDRPRKLVAV
jgi:hypothetical protein